MKYIAQYLHYSNLKYIYTFCLKSISTYKSAGHQKQTHLGEKGVNGGVEQGHAQWIISNLKIKPMHIIL